MNRIFFTLLLTACATTNPTPKEIEVSVVEPAKATLKLRTLQLPQITEHFQKAVEAEGFAIDRVESASGLQVIAHREDKSYYSKAQSVFTSSENYATSETKKIDLRVARADVGADRYVVTMNLEKQINYAMGTPVTEKYRDDALFEKICRSVDSQINRKL